MPFVQGKCENCGGILTVDPNLKAANCPFCGVAYIVEDSINNYNTTIHNVESLHADVVTVMDESSSEARLKAGFAYIKIEKYDLAENEFNYVIKVAPQNHLGWLGLIEALTHNYTKRIKVAAELRKIDEYAKSVVALEPSGKGGALIAKWEAYKKSEEEKNIAEKEELKRKIVNLEREVNQLVEEQDELDKQREHNNDEITKLSSIVYPDPDFPEKEMRYDGLLSLGLLIGIIGVNSLFFSIQFKGLSIYPLVIILSLIASIVGVGFIIISSKKNYHIMALKNLIDEYRSKLDELDKKKTEIQAKIDKFNSEILTAQRTYFLY